MKKLFPLLCCILLFTACAIPYHGPTVEITVPVLRTVEYGSYGEYSGEQTVYTYDSYGNLAQMLTYHEYEYVYKTIYTYDEQGNLVKEVTWDMGNWFELESYPEFPHRTYRYEYTYDDQNRLVPAQRIRRPWAASAEWLRNGIPTGLEGGMEIPG